MKKITPEQLKILHTLLSQLGLINEKAAMVSNLTEGRTTSSRELTIHEARLLIKHLNNDDSGDRMRKKVFALAYEAGIIWGDTAADKKMNLIKINKFIKERGTVKKELHRMTNKELIKTVNQFEMIGKHKDQSKAKKQTDSLLHELSIPTE